MSIRTDRVAGEIQAALAKAFQSDFQDLSDGLITVTMVRMSPDLRSGRVYISLLGGTKPAEKTLEAIKKETPHIRSAVAKAVRMKYVPDLHFYLDDTQEEVAHVEEIFRKIREERAGEDVVSDDAEADVNS
jgi:ribosome-binding factor A